MVPVFKSEELQHLLVLHFSKLILFWFDIWTVGNCDGHFSLFSDQTMDQLIEKIMGRWINNENNH